MEAPTEAPTNAPTEAPTSTPTEQPTSDQTLANSSVPCSIQTKGSIEISSNLPGGFSLQCFLDGPQNVVHNFSDILPAPNQNLEGSVANVAPVVEIFRIDPVTGNELDTSESDGGVITFTIPLFPDLEASNFATQLQKLPGDCINGKALEDTLVCAFLDERRGEWSQEGCSTKQIKAASNGTLSSVECECNHRELAFACSVFFWRSILRM